MLELQNKNLMFEQQALFTIELALRPDILTEQHLKIMQFPSMIVLNDDQIL